MAKKRKTNSKKIIKYSPFLVISAVLLLGIFFALFDRSGILSYKNVSSFLGLSDTEYMGSSEVKVHFIDVGQGDCSLIVSGDSTVLIDAGELQNDDPVCKYLKEQNITKLDYIIATHPHSDHIGGLVSVIENFEVGKIILPKIPDDLTQNTQIYRNLLTAIQRKEMKITPAVPGEEYDLGGISTLKILAPLTDNDNNLNNYSVVCKLVHGNNSFLFTGDAEEEEENDILASNSDINADVLKVGHHGSDTSSKKDFLAAVSPEYCVIMVGAENSYNHPSAKAIERLGKYTNKIYRTDLLGTIIAESDGNNYTFSFEKGND